VFIVSSETAALPKQNYQLANVGGLPQSGSTSFRRRGKRVCSSPELISMIPPEENV
jgi:hypothetical protein